MNLQPQVQKFQSKVNHLTRCLLFCGDSRSRDKDLCDNGLATFQTTIQRTWKSGVPTISMPPDLARYKSQLD